MRGKFITNRNGALNPNYKDGRKNTRLYRIWNNVKSRCYNPHFSQYENYGARGISVCDEWKTGFETFRDWSISHGYTDELTIDRVDNNGNYTPDNCRWVDMKTQCNNKRNNHFVTIENEIKTLAEWCKIYNINYKTVRDRLKRGWTYVDALSKPVQGKFGKRVV